MISIIIVNKSLTHVFKREKVLLKYENYEMVYTMYFRTYASLVGIQTGKILDFDVRNKKCSIC